ncbi:MAG TPA: amino acid adenylation domain-containing protein [Terriglobales bacterium]|nr:amino acid adenylation domain-containing protein [Terriglobales bacterium]
MSEKDVMTLNDRLSRLTPEQRAALAMRLSAARKPKAAQSAVALPQVQPDPARRYEPFPLSDIQQAYLIGSSESVELGNISCLSYFEIEFTDWDQERFELALSKLIERHEMLRCIVLPDGRQQILQHPPKYKVEQTDLRGMDGAKAETRRAEIRARQSRKFNQADAWPLFDIRVTHLPQGKSCLHVTIDLLIADGRSLEIIFGELAQLYRDPDTILPPFELSFRDYLFALESLTGTDSFRESRDYWMNRVPDLPAAPELPMAKNPASIQPVFNRRQMRIEPGLWQSLREKARRSNLTPPGIILAVYAEVLAIWSKNPRFTLNLTLFNRLPLHKQSNDIVGDFTSVNLLEVDNLKPAPFVERAQQTLGQLWQDLNYRYFSGVRVIREISRSQGAGPKAMMPVVFTSLLDLGAESGGPSSADRLGKRTYAISQTPQVCLDFVVHEDRGWLVVSIDAVDELFPAGWLDDFFEATRTLLTQLATDDAAWKRSLLENTYQLLPRRQMETLERVNNTKAPVSDELLHAPFLKQVEARPKAAAVWTPARELSYEELYRRACSVEEELLRRNVQPNQFVAVVMEKGWEQVAGVLGIHFAGGAYVPVDPDLPAERQRYLIENVDAKVVLAHSAVESRLSVPQGVEVLFVDRLEPAPMTSPTPRRRQKPEDLAYVIFTSGSTGVPKGVMIDHRGAMNTCLDINQRFHVGPEDRVLALSRLNFDLSVYDIFGLLAAGGTIVMPSAELAQDLPHWAQLVRSQKVTLWNTVPALMQLLADEVGRGEKIGQSLRVIMMSGDWIPVSLPAQLRKILPKAQIISMGGATEASIWSIMYPIENVDPNWKSIPYGKPMLNQTFHVLSHARGPCPVWVPGQLYIGGIGLAKGYWKDAKKTAAHFMTDPRTGAPLYRTGDWGRYLPDGNIEFLGREDSQVKVQGYRIELGEVEAKLHECAGVETCIVIVREDHPGEKRLVGYAVPKPGVQLDGAALREELRGKLAEYMVPAAIVSLDRIPLTANGKVDRKALPAVARPAGETPEPVTPRDELEAQLVKLWEDLLNVRPVGLRDNFFDLGGHSLLAVRLFSELRKMTGKSLGLSTLFQAPTVEKLAEVLRKHDKSASGWSAVVPIQTQGARPPFFCVHGGGGNVLIYRDLSRNLGPDQPFYGLQSQGLDGKQPLLTRIEDMAALYAEEIRKVQPRGPYFLGGYCMGGAVAFEIARRLRQRGEEVALLAFFETLNLSAVPRGSLASRSYFQTQKLLFHVGNFLQLNAKDQIQFFWEKLKALKDRTSLWQGMLVRSVSKNGDGPMSEAALIAHIWNTNDKAALTYVPGPYDGLITSFRPRAQYARHKRPEVNWETVAEGGQELIMMPSYPAGMLVEPFVKKLAAGLRAAIDKAIKANAYAASTN